MKFRHQTKVSPKKQVVEVDLRQHCCCRVEIVPRKAQFKFRELRSEIIELLPSLTWRARLLKVIRGAMPQRKLGEGKRIEAVIELISPLDARKGVGEIHRVEVVASALFPCELHVHQTSQDWRTIHTG